MKLKRLEKRGQNNEFINSEYKKLLNDRERNKNT